MGQTPTRRRGPQGKPAQQGSPQWVRSGDGVKSVVTEQRYRPAQQGSPPIPEQQNRLGDSGESMKTVRRIAHEPSLESRRAANPERYGPEEYFVVTKGGKGRWISFKQKYRPAEHGSKPIPVHDARYYGDDY